jgi:6-phospho-beta-glucosidase
MIDEFVAFAKTCFEEYQEYGTYWITSNAINVLKLIKDMGGPSFNGDDIYIQMHNQIVAAAKAVTKTHQINYKNKIGCMIYGIFKYPYTCDPQDVLLAQKEDISFTTSEEDITVKGSMAFGVKKPYLQYS